MAASQPTRRENKPGKLCCTVWLIPTLFYPLADCPAEPGEQRCLSRCAARRQLTRQVRRPPIGRRFAMEERMSLVSTTGLKPQGRETRLTTGAQSPEACGGFKSVRARGGLMTRTAHPAARSGTATGIAASGRRATSGAGSTTSTGTPSSTAMWPRRRRGRTQAGRSSHRWSRRAKRLSVSDVSQRHVNSRGTRRDPGSACLPLRQ
jgi:hypothetical protein